MVDQTSSASPLRPAGAIATAQGSLTVVILAVLAGLLAASAIQLADPFVRHDDFPALTGNAEHYYNKTLTEGRWLSYLWHLRDFSHVAWGNYLILLTCWAIYLGCLVQTAFGEDMLLWRKAAVALIAGCSSPWLLIFYWFNTLVPGMAVVAAYALLTMRLSERTNRLLLAVFVPVTLMCYTTFPFLLLMLSLVRRETKRSWRDLATLILWFFACFAFGLLVIYSLNYLYHGHFGVKMASWREPNPATDLASLLENTRMVWEFVTRSAGIFAFQLPAVGILQLFLVVLAVYLAGKEDALRVTYLLVGAGLGLGLIILQTLKSGIELPSRSAGFLTIQAALLMGMLVQILYRRGGVFDRLGKNSLAFFAMLFVALSGMQHFAQYNWQQQTREMARQLSRGAEPIYIIGSYRSLMTARAATIQHPRALALRLSYLMNRPVISCEATPAECEQLQTVSQEAPQQGSFNVVFADSATILQLSDKPVDGFEQLVD